MKNTNLNKLIDLRAKVSLGVEISVMDEFFPQYIDTGNGKKNTLKYLLEHTRHTPRDFIELMNNIQKVSYQRGATTDSIKNGIRKYSENYFVGEIEDGLNGFLTDDEIDMIFRAIRSIGHINTNMNEIMVELKIEREKAIQIMEIMYGAGAIINVSSNGIMTSKFRNRFSSFDPRQTIRVHSGLVKAFSLAPNNGESGNDDF